MIPRFRRAGRARSLRADRAQDADLIRRLLLRRQDLLFFFQAEDGIRDDLVTGVQTCALPISKARTPSRRRAEPRLRRPEASETCCRRSGIKGGLAALFYGSALDPGQSE